VVKVMIVRRRQTLIVFFYGVLSSMLGGEQGKYFVSVL
jgi:hypothetical protein